MIDLTTEKARKQYHRAMLIEQDILANRMQQRFFRLYKAMFKNIAESLKIGNFAYVGVIDSYYERFTRELQKLYRITYRHYYTIIKNLLFPKKKSFYFFKQNDDIDTVEETVDPNLDETMEERMRNWSLFFSQRKTLLIFNTMKESVRTKISESQDLEALSSSISEDAVRNAKYRSSSLVHTEVHSSAMETLLRFMIVLSNATGVRYLKQWLTMEDEKVRHEDFSHVDAHGETQELSNYFVRTGENLMYPGDSFGSPGNIIRCRCWMSFVRRAA